MHTLQLKRNMITKPQITPIIEKYPRDRYIVDLIDLKAYSQINVGYKWRINVIDSFTKFVVSRPLYSKSAQEVSSTLESILPAIWPQIILHTDNGTEFVNTYIANLTSKYGIKHVTGRKRSPWIQGQTERFNGLIKKWLLSTSASNGNFGVWTSCSNDIVFDYNNTTHSTTDEIPALTFLGTAFSRKANEDHIEALSRFNPYETEEVDEAHENARRNTEISAEKMRNQRRWKNDEEPLQEGDCVLLRPDTDA